METGPENPILGDALRQFVARRQADGTAIEDILLADSTRNPWTYTGAVGQGWTFELDGHVERYAVDTNANLYRSTRKWRLRKVPHWFKVREGRHYLVALDPVGKADDPIRDRIISALESFPRAHGVGR